MRNVISSKANIGKASKINREYFQMGRIMEDPFERKKYKTKGDLFQHMAQLDEHHQFTKRKFKEIQTQKMENSRNRKWARMKRQRIKKKVMKH